MTTGIYKIINKINGKIYIGSAVDIETRWRRHKHDLNKNQHQNILLQRSWIKYWSVNFEFVILKICEREKLLENEQYYINNLKPDYNLAPTAGNSLGVKHSEETKKRMSEAKKRMTDKTKQLMSQQRKGKKHTEEHKSKIAASRKGKIHSDETKLKMRNARLGKKASEETKAKISAGNKNLGTKRGKYKSRKTNNDCSTSG